MTKAFEYFTPRLSEPSDEHQFLPNFINAYLCANLSKLCYKESVDAEHTDPKYKEAVCQTLEGWGLTSEDAQKTIFLNSREIKDWEEEDNEDEEKRQNKKRPGTQGLIIFHKKTMFVCFRGSEVKLNDWFTNFNMKKVESPYVHQDTVEHERIWEILNRKIGSIGDIKQDIQDVFDNGRVKIEVHRGFLKAFNAVIPNKGQAYQKLEDITAKLKGQEIENVWLTGHSLGGSLSLIAAHYLLFHDLPVSGVYTFGAPRVGNKGYRVYMDQQLSYKNWRFIHHHDLVPDVPLPRLLSHNGLATGFSREGCMLQFTDKNGQKSYKILRRAYQNGERQVLGIHNGINVKDHSMTNYIEHLRALVLQEIPDFPEMKFNGVPSGVELNSTDEDLEQLERNLEKLARG